MSFQERKVWHIGFLESRSASFKCVWACVSRALIANPNIGLGKGLTVAEIQMAVGLKQTGGDRSVFLPPTCHTFLPETLSALISTFLPGYLTDTHFPSNSFKKKTHTQVSLGLQDTHTHRQRTGHCSNPRTQSESLLWKPLAGHSEGIVLTRTSLYQKYWGQQSGSLCDLTSWPWSIRSCQNNQRNVQANKHLVWEIYSSTFQQKHWRNETDSIFIKRFLCQIFCKNMFTTSVNVSLINACDDWTPK